MALSDNSLIRRIQIAGCQPYIVLLDEKITKVGFRRDDLSAMLGGKTVPLCSTPDAKKWSLIHDYEMFLYPNRRWNPHSPEDIGYPGLLFIGWSERDPQGPIPLFSKIDNKTPALWYYFGHYHIRSSQTLSTQEYLDLPHGVREMASRWRTDVLTLEAS